MVFFFTGLVPAPGPAPQLAEVTCAACSETRGLQKCSGCRTVYHCCAEHQRAHWREHKRACLKTAAACLADGPRPRETPQQPMVVDKSVCETCGGELAVGHFVQLCGLSSAVELVGQRGRLECEDAAAGRWVVRLESDREVKVRERERDRERQREPWVRPRRALRSLKESLEEP